MAGSHRRGRVAAAAAVGVDEHEESAYDDTMYVTQLVADGVVNTMPEATMEAVRDHGVIKPDVIRGRYAQAHATLEALAATGIDYADVVAVLEREGVTKFVAAWTQLERQVGDRLRTAAARVQAAE